MKNMALKGDAGGRYTARQLNQGNTMLQTTEIVRQTDSGRKRASELDDGPQWYADVCQRMRKAGKLTEIVILSPSRAAALLSHNSDNRPISDATVSTFASDILEGRWQFNGEPIIIANTGELNDGQHRCQAVVTSGKAIEVLVVAGVPRKSRFTVDMGNARTVGHFLGMHGMKDANHVAAIALVMHGFEHGTLSRSKMQNALIKQHLRPTKVQLRTYAEANIDDIRRAMSAFTAKECKRIGTYSRLCGLAVSIYRVCKDWDAVEDYFKRLLTGENLGSKDPALVTRNRLLDDNSHKRVVPAAQLFEVVIRGWNAYRGRQKISIVKVLNVIPDIAR